MKNQYLRLKRVSTVSLLLMAYSNLSIAQGVLSICPYCMERASLCVPKDVIAVPPSSTPDGQVVISPNVNQLSSTSNTRELQRNDLAIHEEKSQALITSCEPLKKFDVSQFSSRSVCKGTMVSTAAVYHLVAHRNGGFGIEKTLLSVPLTICDGNLVDVDEYVKDAFRLMAASELKKIKELVSPAAIDERLKSTLVASSLETTKNEIANKVKKEVMDELVSKKVAPKPKK